MKGRLCVTAHPMGCTANVEEQIRRVTGRPPVAGARRVLIVGSSNGLGLSTRIAAAFGSRASTVGVGLEREATPTRTATAGWYNCAAFERAALAEGLSARTVIGDAFTDGTKAETVDAIRRGPGAVDLVVYSLAAPRRRDPETGVVHQSVLKPIGAPFTGKTYDFASGEVGEQTLAPADDAEIRDTVAVMGGEDWSRWIRTLRAEGVLAPGATTVAYSYIGQESLAPTYRAGTMGRAKEHLEATARALDAEGLRARVAVMKAMVTQSSVAIPMSTLYTMILARVMREYDVYEDPIDQVYRLLAGHLAERPGDKLGDKPEDGPAGFDSAGFDFAGFDDEGRIRLDDLELREDVQREVDRRLALATTANLDELADREGFHSDVLRLYGFGHPDVDYSADVDPVLGIPSMN
jgi:enoyl-[acyl-carrier protein] reductase/trans-2-enoyl-CoA reductase (NAD+)